jgi:hypothetical protein
MRKDARDGAYSTEDGRSMRTTPAELGRGCARCGRWCARCVRRAWSTDDGVHAAGGGAHAASVARGVRTTVRTLREAARTLRRSRAAHGRRCVRCVRRVQATDKGGYVAGDGAHAAPVARSPRTMVRTLREVVRRLSLSRVACGRAGVRCGRWSAGWARRA